MMEIIYFIFILVLFVGGVIVISDGGIFPVGIALLLFAIPYSGQIKDSVVVSEGDRIVSVTEEYRDRIKEEINSLPKIQSSLMNGDTPYLAMLDNLAGAEQKILESKKDIITAEMRIQRRKLGVTAFVFWFIGDVEKEDG